MIQPTLDILFEDEALIFINKPAGVVVQQRMHQPDEPYLHADVARHTSPAYLMQRLDRGTATRLLPFPVGRAVFVARSAGQGLGAQVTFDGSLEGG